MSFMKDTAVVHRNKGCSILPLAGNFDAQVEKCVSKGRVGGHCGSSVENADDWDKDLQLSTVGYSCITWISDIVRFAQRRGALTAQIIWAKSMPL